ncbi:MAG: choice-of-anchor tandem repeat GloVer-containing protein [Candidatus Korobacteraceae bacterium]
MTLKTKLVAGWKGVEMETVGNCLQKEVLIQPRSHGVGCPSRGRRTSAGIDLWMTLAAIAIAILLLIAATEARAQTFTTLHNFGDGSDGGYPYAGLSMDRAGNLYGTASEGGNLNYCYQGGCGTVFRLERRSSGWIYSVLYAFTGSDGYYPEARVIIGPDGGLYGTTTQGGASGAGVVFRLQPPATICKAVSCPWTETVLHSFTGGSDGGGPTYGDLTFDQAGNIYGTTTTGGNTTCGGGYGCGVVFELAPSNGAWNETVLYTFQGGTDGSAPYAGVIFDRSGNLYGTNGSGVVYELTPSAGGWLETTISNLQSSLQGGLIFDSAGNLYGATIFNPVVYELSPSSGGWTLQTLYNFSNVYEGSFAQVTLDGAGNLYGTISFGPPEVFRLTKEAGQWTMTGFSGGDGETPYGNVILDASGNIYTTASFGESGSPGAGSRPAGTVFEITP